MDVVGIVLAAGASQRMGSPKALLPLNGKPLGLHQLETLQRGGCGRARIVLGAQAKEIRRALGDVEAIENPLWQTGRMTSLQAALRAIGIADGALFMPVDAPGISAEIIRDMLDTFSQHPGSIIRPVYHGQPGHLLLLPRISFADLLRQPAAQRVDTWAAAQTHVHSLETNAPAILQNINTPADWQAFLDHPS